jgi:hypothetical protein
VWIVPSGLNTGSITVQLGATDLAVTQVGVQPNPILRSANNCTQYQFTVTYTVKNLGSIPFNNQWINWVYLSSNQYPGGYLVNTSTPNLLLNPGDSRQWSKDITTPYTGNYIVVRAVGTGYDGNLDNNFRAKAVTFSTNCF